MDMDSKTVLVKLLASSLVIEAASQDKNYGIPICLQCATCYTDYWEAYSSVLPSKRHKAVGKESGKTNYVERRANGSLALYGKLYPFPRNGPTTLEQFGPITITLRLGRDIITVYDYQRVELLSFVG